MESGLAQRSARSALVREGRLAAALTARCVGREGKVLCYSGRERERGCGCGVNRKAGQKAVKPSRARKVRPWYKARSGSEGQGT